MTAGAPALRLVYMGTAAFAVPSLRALAAGPHEVVAVYTQPARAAGRGLKARPSPVIQTRSKDNSGEVPSFSAALISVARSYSQRRT